MRFVIDVSAEKIGAIATYLAKQGILLEEVPVVTASTWTRKGSAGNGSAKAKAKADPTGDRTFNCFAVDPAEGCAKTWEGPKTDTDTYVKVQNLLCEICHEAGCDSSKIEIAMKARGESVSTEAKHF